MQTLNIVGIEASTIQVRKIDNGQILTPNAESINDWR